MKIRVWTGKEMITPPSWTIGAGSGAEIIEIALDGRISTRNAYGLDGYSKNPAFDEPDENMVAMLCSGEPDKNGKEIYVGDLIEQFSGEKKAYPVEFKNGCFMWKNEPLCYDFGVRDDPEEDMYYPPRMWAVVVGNVYENPGLMVKEVKP